MVSSETNHAQIWRVTGPEIMQTDKYLSGANAPEFEEDVRLCIESGARDMVIDCTSMTYATGAGMRAFLNIARMMQQAGGKLTVHGLAGQPHEIFTACGMDMMIPAADEMLMRIAAVGAA